MAEPIVMGSTEYRSWPVTAVVDGVAIDPTADPVALAFMADSSVPTGADFVVAEWETIGSAPAATYRARALIGPGQLDLTAGIYRVWLKITDTPEAPVLAIDTLRVLDGFATPGGTYMADPASSTSDQVRLLVGDTTAPFMLSDSEVAWFLAAAGNQALPAAAGAAGALAARFAGLVDSSVGDVSKSYSQKAKGFAELAERLAADAATAVADGAVPIPWAGGISYAERESNAADGDLVPPYFYEGMGSRLGTTNGDREGSWLSR